MEDLASFGSSWLSVDEPPEPERGWYAVMRLHPDLTGSPVCGAAYFGKERWGKSHHVFARSSQVFDDPEAAEEFAATRSGRYGATVARK